MDLKFSVHGTQILIERIVENLDTTLDFSISEYLISIKDFFVVMN